MGACLVATSFKGWGGTWGDSWGPISTNPNDMSASGGFVLLATAQATALLFAQGSSPLSVSATGTLTAAVVSNDMAGTAAFTFSAIGILTDPNAYPDRRPKSTNTLKLQKIKEGKAWLQSAKIATRAKPLRASGYATTQIAPVVLPGEVRAVACKSSVRAKVLRSSSGSSIGILRSTIDVSGRYIRSSGSGGSRAQSSMSDTNASTLRSFSAGITGVRSAQTGTTCERLRSSGKRNISDYELAAVVRLIDTRR